MEATIAKLGDKAVAVLSDVPYQANFDELRGTIEAQDDQLNLVFANAKICEKNSAGETIEAANCGAFDVNVKGTIGPTHKF